MRTNALATLLIVVIACAAGCPGTVAGPCVLPECDDGFVESDVACDAGEGDAACHVIDGGACGGQVTCRPGDDGGE